MSENADLEIGEVYVRIPDREWCIEVDTFGGITLYLKPDADDEERYVLTPKQVMRALRKLAQVALEKDDLEAVLRRTAEEDGDE